MIKELSKALLRSCASYFKVEKQTPPAHAIENCMHVIKVFCAKKAIPARFREICDWLPKMSLQSVGQLMQVLHVFIGKSNPQLAQFSSVPKPNLEMYAREVRLILLKEIKILQDVYHGFVDLFELRPKQIE
jgi:hypothetical protein